MKKSVTWGLLAGLVVLALVASGVAVAANMGFKFVPQVTANKAFNLSIPWNNNYAKANDLLTDTGAQSVQRFTTVSTLVSWSGSGSNFAMASGEAFILNAGAGGLTPTIVGSHAPSQTLSFGAGEAVNTSVPYHQAYTPAKANAMLVDLQAFSPGNIQSVQRFTEDSTLVSWSGSGSNFALNLGEGVIVNATGAVSGYQVPHY